MLVQLITIMLYKFLVVRYSTELSIVDTKAVIGKQRRLLLALQWINFPADTDDLLLLHSLDIYWKLVVLCGLVSTKIEDDVVLPDSQLTLRTNLSSLFQLENVALRTG